MSFAAAQYRAARVETASPATIVVQMYDGAIRFLTEAQMAIEGGDTKRRANALKRSHAIVGELQASLDHNHAPELCQDLERLYDFVLWRIAEASSTTDPAFVQPAINVMSEMRGAWADLAQRKL